MVLQVDKLDRFKAIAIEEIKTYKTLRGDWPKAIIIDVPRDEETKNLHEIYAVLEKLNDGTLISYFGGRKQKLDMDIGIPVIVMTNSAPLLAAMSNDRWDIFALNKVRMLTETDITVSEKEDYFLFQATAESWVNKATNASVTWQNKIQTTALSPRGRQEDGTRYESDKLLYKMQSEFIENIKKYPALATGEWEENPVTGTKTRISSNGFIESYGDERASTINKAPEVVVKWWTYLRNNFEKKVA